MQIKNKLIPRLMSKLNIGRIDKLAATIPVIKPAYKFLIQRTIDYDFPRHIFLESTSACNFHCKVCPRTGGNRTTGNMDFEVFKKVVDEAKSYGPRSFCLHVFGEPLLTPNIAEMIEYIKKSHDDNAIILTTNGSLLDEEKARALIKYRVDKVAISFMSPNERTYAEKTGVNKLREVENNIERLIALKKEKKSDKPIIFVRMIVANDTEGQASDFLKKWKNKKVVAELRDASTFGGNIQETHTKIRKRYPCYHLWLAPSVSWEGNVLLCCVDYAEKTVLGNVKNQSLHEIWTGEKMRQYRKFHLQSEYGKIAPCKNCDDWNIYSDLFFNWQKK